MTEVVVLFAEKGAKFGTLSLSLSLKHLNSSTAILKT